MILNYITNIIIKIILIALIPTKSFFKISSKTKETKSSIYYNADKHHYIKYLGILIHKNYKIINNTFLNLSKLSPGCRYF